MRPGPLPSFAFLTVASVCLAASSLAAGVAGDPLAAEAEVRKADADWTAAVSTHSVDAWMSFYAADAIVRLPQDQLAGGRESIRQAVVRLLAPPHLSMASRPIDVQVDRSANVASLIESYELRFDSQGTSASSRGRRLEIWRKQPDGSWRCTVDIWNLDESPAAATTVPPAIVQAAPATAAPQPPLERPQPPAGQPQAPAAPAAPAPADAGSPAAAPAAVTKYGDEPVNYEQTIRQYFQERLNHPESVQYREITRPEQGYVDKLAGAVLLHEKRIYGWIVKATLNTQDSHEKYIGFKTYAFLFRGEKIIDARLSLPGAEVK
jgi:ketosteroid isomerase-like protein